MLARVTTGNDLRLDLGEGPVWDAASQRLWWVDSEAGLVFSGRISGDSVIVEDVRSMGEKVGSVAPCVDGGLLVAGAHHVHVVDPHGQLVDSLRVLPELQRSRLNDGTCDPAGRFLVGSIRLDGRERQECLWAVEPDRSVRPVVEGITVSNGIGFAPDGRTMYYVESRPGAILAFDYDVTSGTASHRRELWACGGTPDGLAVDAEGYLWVAFFGEGDVRRISPEGEVIDTITVEARNVTCPEFVGPRLDRLVITTARYRMSEADLSRQVHAGATFIADPSVGGVAPVAWAGSTRCSG